MNITPDRLVSNRIAITLFCLVLFCLFYGCNSKKIDKNNRIIDSILLFDDTKPLSPQLNKSLDSIRNLIDEDDIPRLSLYYRAKFYGYNANHEPNNIYVDSSFALFNSEKNIKKYKSEYFKALLLKADGLYLTKKYNLAVIKYLEAKAFREKNLDICAYRELASSIGNVYYRQDKFLKAASYYKESYDLEIKCNTSKIPFNHFFLLQGLLNNIGYCYEKANLLDSAKLYYQKNLNYIEQLQKDKSISTYALDDTKAVAYDNLGSVYLKEGNLKEAESYLLKCLSIKYSGDKGVYIPPMIKLATLYTFSKDFNKAQDYLDSSSEIMNKIYDPDLECRWYKAKADLSLKQKNFETAYAHQQKYIKLHDSILKANTTLASISIEKELENIDQKYTLQDLEKKGFLKNIYLFFTLFLLVLVILIVLLLIKNIKQAKTTNQKIEVYNEELKENLLKLEDANQNYARIMKVMAHDLKNPLAGISSISTLLLDEDDISKKNKSSISVIVESADNAIGMINEILNSFLFVIGKIKMKRENINIQLVIAQCVSMLHFKAKEKGQKLIFNRTSELIIHANKEKLWRLFNNLIVNAIKFSKTQQTIIIDITELPRHIVVSITDRGIGIPDDIAANIFDVFTEAKREGTAGEKAYGLGLSISKQIVEAHFGKIWFEKNNEGGTTFYVQLPK